MKLIFCLIFIIKSIKIYYMFACQSNTVHGVVCPQTSLAGTKYGFVADATDRSSADATCFLVVFFMSQLLNRKYCLLAGVPSQRTRPWWKSLGSPVFKQPFSELFTFYNFELIAKMMFPLLESSPIFPFLITFKVKGSSLADR